jgi:DNA-binding NarL/FixJ family response regulator
MIRLIIADDHLIFRQGLKALLENESEIEVIGETGNGNETLSVTRQLKPDLIIMDIEMPGKDGLEVTAILKKEIPEIKILVLTSFNRSAYVRQMLKSKVAGYILKESGREELLKAIRTIMSGEKYFSQKVMMTVIDDLQGPKPGSIQLSDREIEIIKYIASELTSVQIAEKLNISPHTVETHRKNILLKLDLKNTAGLVKYAFKKGLID